VTKKKKTSRKNIGFSSVSLSYNTHIIYYTETDSKKGITSKREEIDRFPSLMAAENRLNYMALQMGESEHELKDGILTQKGAIPTKTYKWWIEEI
jgi:hypothetical protein